jgi:hypothetical protein
VTGGAPRWLTDTLHRLEGEGRLVADRLAEVAGATLATPDRRSALRGEWFGHALHPVLTDFPLGSWMSASLLDLVGGRAARPASRRVDRVRAGGDGTDGGRRLAEWEATSGGTRRVGVVHAAVNGTATVLYASSWLARRRGRHARGVLLGIAGGLRPPSGATSAAICRWCARSAPPIPPSRPGLEPPAGGKAARG